MVATVRLRSCNSTSTRPGTSTVNSKTCPGRAATSKVCSGTECTCSLSEASLLTRMMIGSPAVAATSALVGVTVPPAIVMSTTVPVGAGAVDEPVGVTAGGAIAAGDVVVTGLWEGADELHAARSPGSD